jgi:hypothetical protein
MSEWSDHVESKARVARARRRKRIAYASFIGMFACVAVFGYKTFALARERDGLAPAAARGRRLCEAVRATIELDIAKLEQTENARWRDSAAESLLGDRGADAADLVEMCTPLPRGNQFSECRAAKNYACLAQLARELRLEIAPELEP